MQTITKSSKNTAYVHVPRQKTHSSTTFFTTRARPCNGSQPPDPQTLFLYFIQVFIFDNSFQSSDCWFHRAHYCKKDSSTAIKKKALSWNFFIPYISASAISHLYDQRPLYLMATMNSRRASFIPSAAMHSGSSSGPSPLARGNSIPGINTSSSRYSDVGRPASPSTTISNPIPINSKSSYTINAPAGQSTSNFHHSNSSSRRFSLRRAPSPPAPVQRNSTYPASPVGRKPSIETRPPNASNTVLNSINRQNGPQIAPKRTSSVKSKEKRNSIFPWSNRKASGSSAPTHNNYYNSGHMPVISDPILEFSTADFFTSEEGLPTKARPVPTITTYAPSQHAINTRNSIIGDPRAKPLAATAPPRRANSMAASHSFGQPTRQFAAVAEEHSSTTSMTSQINEQFAPVKSPRKISEPAFVQAIPEDRRSTEALQEVAVQTESAAISLRDNPVELRKRLRESEEKAITVLIEYQQKIDKSRKRIMDLEQRLDEEKRINREIARSGGAQEPFDEEDTRISPAAETFSENHVAMEVLAPPAAAVAVADPGSGLPPSSPTALKTSNISLTTEQLQVRITSLEAQRDNLRAALKALRTTKDLEIKQYQTQVSRLTRMNAFQRSVQADPYMGRATTTNAGTAGMTLASAAVVSPALSAAASAQKKSRHARSFSSQPSFAATQQEVAPPAPEPVPFLARTRNPSVDLTASDASYISPMSDSSNGTIHSLSSTSSTVSSVSSSGSSIHEKQAAAGNRPPPSIPLPQTPQGQADSGVPRRIGIGPFLPMRRAYARNQGAANK